MIIARTARLDAAGATARRDSERVDPATTRGDRSAWAAVLVGIAVVIVAQVYGLLEGELTLDVTTARIGGWMAGFGGWPNVGPAVTVLAAGVVLSLVGLFGTVRGAGALDPPQAER